MRKLQTLFARLWACMSMTLVTCWAEAQWTLTASNVTYYATMKTVRIETGVPAGTWEWECNVPNWFWVVGDTTQEPAWSNFFASLCQNSWTWSDTLVTTNEEGDTVYFDGYAHERYGYETFIRTNPTGAARRDIKRSTLDPEEYPNQPGYHVTDYVEARISHMGSGGSGGGS